LTLRPFGAFQFALQVGRHLLEAPRSASVFMASAKRFARAICSSDHIRGFRRSVAQCRGSIEGLEPHRDPDSARPAAGIE
jgi:hypothetical protein